MAYPYNVQNLHHIDWLLQSSGKFTTDSSRYFLEQTPLPANFLRLCVEDRLKHGNSKKHHQGSHFSLEQLNKICQTMVVELPCDCAPNRQCFLCGSNCRKMEPPAKTPATLLALIRREKLAMRKNLATAKILVDSFGPVHWKGFLESFDGEDIGICPNPSCKMLIHKHGGCSAMYCHCRHFFQWSKAKLGLQKLPEACLFRSGNTRQMTMKEERIVSEFLFRQRLLESAEQGLLCAMRFPVKKKSRRKKRPILHTEDPLATKSRYSRKKLLPILQTVEYNEDHDDGIENLGHRHKSHRRPYTSLPLIEEDSYEVLDQRYSCEALPHEIVSFVETDESISVHTTPPTDSSLCDYIFLSEGDGASHSSASNPDHYWEDEYSVLSGCETVHSLEDRSDTRGGTTTMMLSYCNAAKLGISAAKKVRESPPMQGLSSRALTKEPATTASPQSLSACHIEARHNKASNENVRSDSDYDGEDDGFLSIYEAVKSGHGGRLSSRFRGNCRTQRPACAWGNHRRPNWSRKRRKEQKVNARSRYY